MRGLPASLARRCIPFVLIAFSTMSVSCSAEQRLHGAPDRHDHDLPEIGIHEVPAHDTEARRQRDDAQDHRIEQIERQLSELKSQLAERLTPTTVPSTLPSDSTTLPARIPAP